MSVYRLGRRAFLAHGFAAGAGLVIGMHFDGSKAHAATAGVYAGGPDAFVRIGADDTVTVIVQHSEFGQGSCSGLPILVAEELDCAWTQLRAAVAVADPARQGDLNCAELNCTDLDLADFDCTRLDRTGIRHVGVDQGTGGSR